MNILLTTDFSYGAQKAIHYIINTFGTKGVAYTLLNTQNIKRAGATFDSSFFSEVLTFHEKELHKFSQELKNEYTDIKVNCIAESGPLVAVVEQELRQHKYELIAVGANGAANLYEKLIGTSAKAILKYSKIPVIVVPVITQLSLPSNILVAVDSHFLNIKNQLVNILQGFKNKSLSITLFHIDEADDMNDDECQVLKHELSALNSHIEIESYTKKSSTESIDNQILEFAENHEMDMIITSPNNHSFFERLFTQSITNLLFEKTHLPLIALKN